MTPETFPIYIPTKGRSDSRLTIRYLQYCNIRFSAIVEESEFDLYRAHVHPPDQLLILPQSYIDSYNAMMELPPDSSKGSGPARNFAWDHAVHAGHTHHWIVDDNIRSLWRFNKSTKYRFIDYSGFLLMEQFALQYENLALSGPDYVMFHPSALRRRAPFRLNRAIFSCILIRNDLPVRWRGRYNEDVDLALRLLKNRWCTVLHHAVLQLKTGTQYMRGGNTDAFYASEGTKNKSLMLYHQHPDVVRLTTKWGRAHHHIRYRDHFRQRLIRDPDAQSVSVRIKSDVLPGGRITRISNNPNPLSIKKSSPDAGEDVKGDFI